jgi:hypothetical protein
MSNIAPVQGLLAVRDHPDARTATMSCLAACGQRHPAGPAGGRLVACPAGPRAAAPTAEVDDPPSVVGARLEAQPGTALAPERSNAPDTVIGTREWES